MANTNDPAVFWREYEAKHGEKVLAHSLGCYQRGWEEFEGPLWGLLIATDGGFRFHHFPHEGWIRALARISGGGGEEPTERTIFIPSERLRSAELLMEKSWIRKLLTARPPQLGIRYSTEAGGEGFLLAETDKTALPVAEALKKLIRA